MDAALTALKRNPALTRDNLGKQTSYRKFLSQPMITGSEARQLRHEMKYFLNPQGNANASQVRSANECLRAFTNEYRVRPIAPSTSTNRAFLGLEATEKSSEALLIDRFEQNGKPIRTAFDPLLPLTKSDKSNPLQPNTIISHKGTHRDRGVYITYTREGTQWYRNASGKTTLVDIRPENIAAKLKLPHDNPEKRQFELIQEEIQFGSTAIVYGEPDAIPSKPQAAEDFQVARGVGFQIGQDRKLAQVSNPEGDFNIVGLGGDAEDEEDLKESIRQENEKKLQSLEAVNQTPITNPGLGLSNGANNCFMNAALAAFRGINAQPTGNDLPRLNNYLGGKVATEGQACALREEIARNLKDFPKDIKSGIINGLAPRQHDSFAVFQALLETSDFPKLDHSESLAYNNSTGVHEVKIIQQPDTNRSPILPLSLEQGDTSIQNLINRNYQPENILDYKPDDKQPFETSATKTILLTTAPEKLAVQIKRFAYDNAGGTSRMPNSFNDITGAVNLTTFDGSQHAYQPKGIICHLPGNNASNANSGHYVYYEHQGGNNWREINDGQAADFDITQDTRRLKQIQDNCYVVTYENQNP
jgi:hypothetical protein